MTGDRAVTKDEIDVEKHFLRQTVRLSDGTDGLIFSRGHRNEHQFIYNCHLCGVANLPGERCLQTHISGRKHQTKLQQPVIDSISFRLPLVQKPKIQMNIAPGEPVPPGFEDEVRPMAQIQIFLNKYKDSALIGIEYSVELNISDDREPGYICLLCDKRGDPRTIISHWSSYNHRLKYLEKHFPMVIKELVSVRYNPEARNLMPKIIESLSEAIEDHHGRLLPVVCDNNDFKRKRNSILQEMMAEKHFDEKAGPNFMNAIKKNLIDELKGDSKVRDPSPPNVKAPKRKPGGNSGFDKILSAKRKDRNSLDSISSDSNTSLNNLQLNRNRTRSRSNDRFSGNSNKVIKRKKSQSPAFRILPRVQRSPPFGETQDSIRNDKKKSSLPTPKELSLQASEIAQERYKWEKYRCMLEIATADLEKSLKNYEKNPEKHPLYPEEWKQFWNRRYKELQAEKKDPNKYDFKPEWVIFWTKRMKELHDEDIEKKKKELRKRLSLPDDAEERTDELKEQYKIKTPATFNKLSTSSQSHKTTTVSSSRANNKSSAPAVIDISDDEDLLNRPSKSAKRSDVKSRSFSRSLSPISDDNDRRRKHSRYSRERERTRDYSRERERDYRRSRSRDREIERLRERDSLRERERYPIPGPPPGEYFHRGPRMILAPGSHPHPFAPRVYYPAPHQQPPSAYGFRSMDPYNYPKYEPEVKAKEPEPADEGPLTVVAVLRLLTALEEHLGSLGPKVVDLLSKALALEKVKANSADDMLINDDHCVFFETVKEKLKGQLIAGVLDANKVKTVKRAIKNIAGIIHQVTEKQNSVSTTKTSDEDGTKTEEEKLDENNKNSKKVGNKELPFDRQLISSKLAAALVMQERTDITKDEMDKLIYVFILMVKMSKERDCTVSVQDILIELGIILPPPIVEDVIDEADIEEEIPEDILESIQDVHQPNSNDVFEEATDVVSGGPQDGEEEDGNQQSGVGDLESLTDSDLQTLLQNFKHLSSEEQHHLISHLKKLESTNPIRVEKLRKFVNIADLKNEVDKSKTDKPNTLTNIKMKIANPINNKRIPSPKKQINIFSDDEYDDDDDDSKLQKMIDSEDEDDDYNFDDVVKAASKNINRRNTDDSASHRSNHSHRIDSINRDNTGVGDISNMSKASSSLASTSTANLGMSLADTQNLIANLMGSLQKSSGQFTNNSSTENNGKPKNNVDVDGAGNSGTKKPISATIPILVNANANKNKNHNNVTTPYFQQQPLANEQLQQQQMQMQLQQQQIQQQQMQQTIPINYQQQGQQFGYNNMYYQNYNMPQAQDYNVQSVAGINYNYDYSAQSNNQQQQPYNFQNFSAQSNYMAQQQPQQQRK